MKTENELIAEFMGINLEWGVENAYYSWESLMNVVIAIEEIELPHPSNNPEKGTIWPFHFEILGRNVVQIINQSTSEGIVCINKNGISKKDSVRMAIVEFIRWYNSQNS